LHVLVDGLAGCALALATYLGTARGYRVHRWLRLRDVVAKRG
jgi:hypothetical protein